MKTETIELTKTELDYLLSVVHEQIDSGVSWGNQAQFIKMCIIVLQQPPISSQFQPLMPYLLMRLDH